ncbi:chloride channel protein [Corynebacterium aquilae]|uniref:chloride channel protein n=1 Tax=Corynebacterium aquilae TaxID=203263 RepID=UPI0009521492|nr:chloride channel protein [Corynebacterium aquilae]
MPKPAFIPTARQRGRQRFSVAEIVRFRRGGLYLMAVIIGILAGLGAVAFRYGIHSWEYLLTGQQDATLPIADDPKEAFELTGILAPLGRWGLIIAPVISAVIYAPLMYFFGASECGRGVAGVMYSVRKNYGRVKFTPAATTTAASALTIGGGGNVGPEGPISELGGAIGHAVSTWFHAPRTTARLLTATGVAAGVSAAFNAPLAGAFFAMEVILLDFTSETFVCVVIACVAATMTNKQFVGDSLSFTLHQDLTLARDTDLGWVIVLAVIGGIVGVAFSKIRYLAEDAVDHIWRGPVWLRPILGSIILGAVLFAVPAAYGEGDAVLNGALRGELALQLVLILFAVKFIATALTVAIGGVGGTFAPSLFIGGMLGAIFGAIVEPSNAYAMAIFGMIGMGAVFTGAARAPMTGVLLIMELTGQFRLLLPLMLAVVIATGIARLLSETTIYTEALARRGVDPVPPPPVAYRAHTQPS